MCSFDSMILAPYNVCKIVPEQNCLFSALSVCIYGTEDHYSHIHNKVVTHIVDKLSSHNYFIIGDRLHTILITDEYFIKLMQ